MLKYLLIFLFVLGVSVESFAQTKRVREKDLKGVWEMKIDLEDDLISKEAEDEDNLFARVVLLTVGNLVEGVIAEVNIRIEFLPEGKCKINASWMGSDSEESEGSWFIEDGKLYLDDFENIDFDEDEYWLFEEDVLVLREADGKVTEDAQVYIYRID